MKIIKQIFAILLFYIIGEFLAYFINLLFPAIFIPGTILGLIVLVVLIITRKISLDKVDEVGTFLTNNMAFFFIPAAVSVIEYFDILKETILKIIIIITISSFLSFFAIYGSIKLTLKLTKHKEE